jgi:hypothetical protein
MADTFNSLRGNDLIWSFFINNYLMGKEPRPFDLLFWNADQTRMPKALHLYYLRNFYKDNALTQGRLTWAARRWTCRRSRRRSMCSRPRTTTSPRSAASIAARGRSAGR